ncbi:MAG: hypothetical protein KGZ63_11550 [Clostridiales bacterium]|jgi:hypothetical protein|nr:hypothetical protein [Clostridiales bacterium]
MGFLQTAFQEIIPHLSKKNLGKIALHIISLGGILALHQATLSSMNEDNSTEEE